MAGDRDVRRPWLEDESTVDREKRSGRVPEGPAHKSKGGLVQTLKRTVAEFKEDELTDRAAALT